MVEGPESRPQSWKLVEWLRTRWGIWTTAHEGIKERLFPVPSDDGEGHDWYQGKGWVQKWNPGMRAQVMGTQEDHE